MSLVQEPYEMLPPSSPHICVPPKDSYSEGRLNYLREKGTRNWRACVGIRRMVCATPPGCVPMGDKEVVQAELRLAGRNQMQRFRQGQRAWGGRQTKGRTCRLLSSVSVPQVGRFHTRIGLYPS